MADQNSWDSTLSMGDPNTMLNQFQQAANPQATQTPPPSGGMSTTDQWGSYLPAGIGNAQQATQATAAFRQSPWYQQWMKDNGVTPQQGQNQFGNVTLNDAQQKSLLNTARQNGIGISDSYHIDQNGQIAHNDSHLLRNILLGAAAGGLALTGIGAAGLGPMAGLFGAGTDAAAGAGIAGSEAAGAAGATAAGSGLTAAGMGTGGLVGAGDAIGGLLPTTAIAGGTGIGSAAGAGALGSLVPATSGLDISGALASGGLSGAADGGIDITPSTQVSAAEPTTMTSGPTGWVTSPTTQEELTQAADAEEQGLTPLTSTPLGASGPTAQIVPAITGGTGSSLSSGTNSIIAKLLGGAKAAGGTGNSGGGGASDISSLLGSLAHGIQNNRLQTGQMATQYDNAAVNAQDSANRARASALKQLASSNYLLNGGYRGGQQQIQLNGQQRQIPQLLQAPDPASAAQKQGASDLQTSALKTLAPGGTVSPIPFSSYGTPGTGETIAQAGSAITGLLPTVGKIFNWF